MQESRTWLLLLVLVFLMINVEGLHEHPGFCWWVSECLPGAGCGAAEAGDNDLHNQVSLAWRRGKDVEGLPALVDLRLLWGESGSRWGWARPDSRLFGWWGRVSGGWGQGCLEAYFSPPGLLQLDHRSLGLRACLQRSRCSGAAEVKLSAEHSPASAIRGTHFTRPYTSL